MKIAYLVAIIVALAGPVRAEVRLDCLSKLVCDVKERIRWRTPAWDEKQCQAIAEAVLASSEKYSVSPGLILGTAINESELNEGAVRVTYPNSRTAKDSGLMGIRCILDTDRMVGKRMVKAKGACINGVVRGLPWVDLMDPVTNIEKGAEELAFFRDQGSTTNRVITTVGHHGRRSSKLMAVQCPHLDHAWWAHFNHGPRYIDHGPARHYPHRVAVLYAALLRSLDEPLTEELKGPITIADKGAKPRSIDKPVGDRQRRLVSLINASAGTCQKLASSGTLETDAGETAAADERGHQITRCAIAKLGGELPGRAGTVPR